jgi:thiol:disulfide interchange protein DsbA
MNPIRRTLVAALALTPLTLRAQQKSPEYTELPKPLPVDNPAKVEVAEFFWYGCIHCYSLEPALEAWIPKLPSYSYFRRIPAVFNERWAIDAGIFYSFETLGVLEKLHKPFFDAIHKDRLKTDNPAALSEWLQKNGIDPKTMDETMRSFGVQSKVKRAIQYTGASKIDGTPALMVHGRYTISAEQGRTREGMLGNAERLLPVVRKTLTASK